MVDWLLWSLFTVAIGRLSATSRVGDGKPAAFNSDVSYERANFSQLLAANPNYFGNAPNSGQEPVFPLANDTSYEQLECVGFNPVLNFLSATIEVKLPYGFDGDLCTNGSWEYVRFWVSYGGDWTNIGYVSVNTHDIPDGKDCNGALDKPLFYTLTLPFDPLEKNCSSPVLPNIRTVLSWSEIPSDTDPNWSPVWGNLIDQHIQSMLNSSSPATLQQAVVHYPGSFAADNPICSQEEKISNDTIDELYSLRDRIIAPQSGVGQSPLPGHVQSVASSTVFEDTVFEELTCLGLDYSLSSLVATVKIKRPDGYGTDPCHNGSLEYVSFWADWNNTCNYTYLGTQKINVHDFAKIPADGLAYTAIMPVDTNSARSYCNKTKIARVRAAVSYNEPPPTPPALPLFGNWLETHVQLQPYTTKPGTGGDIEVIGDVFVDSIDTTVSGFTLPDAQYAFPPGITTDRSGLGRQCPFGGRIRIQSLSDPPPNTSYRVMARLANPPDPTFPGTPVTNPVTVVIQGAAPPTGTNLADANGYFDYLPRTQNYWGELASWVPPIDGAWQIRLETATQSIPHVHIAYTPWYTIFISNERPSGDVQFTTGSICGDLTVGQNVTGTFYATTTYFDAYSLSVVPGLIPHSIIPAGGTNEVKPWAPWTLVTTGGQACGYVVALYVRALTVYDSSPFEALDYGVDHGFCLRNLG